MLKKSTFCLFIFALLLGSGNLLAQELVQFSIAPPQGGVVKLPEGAKLNLRNAAELTPEELKAALETSTCGDAKADKDLDACYACTAANCTGTCYRIPCGFYINANQQVPPVVPGFLSFATGCTRTFVSTCNDLNPTAPCQTFFLDTAVVGDNACFNSSIPLQSVGCI